MSMARNATSAHVGPVLIAKRLWTNVTPIVCAVDGDGHGSVHGRTMARWECRTSRWAWRVCGFGPR